MSITSIKNWFLKPYYLSTSVGSKLLKSFGLGFFAIIFLLIIKPPFINSITTNFSLFAINSGCILTSVFLFFNFILIPVFPKFFDAEKWNISKHLFSFALLILTASYLNWSFNFYLEENATRTIKSYTSFLSSFIVIAVFPISLYLFIDERLARKKREKGALDIRARIIDKISFLTNKKEDITLTASNSKEQLSFNINELIFINSDGNYACFHLKDSETIKEKILRKQLTTLEKDFRKYKNIIRCHRSFMINTNYVINVTGNARGYYLHFKEPKKQIPVSRKFKKKDLIAMLSN